MPAHKGGFHPNPQVARMHEQADPMQDQGQEQQPSEPAMAVEIHHPMHPETGDGQNYHTVVHHASGETEEAKHGSYDEAEDHARERFQEPDGDEQDLEADHDGEPRMNKGKAKEADDGAY